MTSSFVYTSSCERTRLYLFPLTVETLVSRSSAFNGATVLSLMKYIWDINRDSGFIKALPLEWAGVTTHQ